MMTTGMTTTTQNPSGIILFWVVFGASLIPAIPPKDANYDGTRAAAATAVVHWQVHLQAPAGTEGAVALHQQAWRWRLRRQVLLQVPGSIHKAREYSSKYQAAYTKRGSSNRIRIAAPLLAGAPPRIRQQRKRSSSTTMMMMRMTPMAKILQVPGIREAAAHQ